MPVSELAIANSLFWLLGYDPLEERGRALAERLRLHHARDDAELRSAVLACAEFRQSYAERHRLPQNQALDLERPRLIFLHIPKCGGTTLHSILARHFAPDEVCPERFNGLRARRLEELAGFSFFSGHHDLESCRALFGQENRIVTLLREPRARLISLYYFLTIHRPESEPATASMVSLARSTSAEAFFTHPMVRRHASVRNAMVSLFTQPHRGVRWEAIDSQLEGADLVLTDPAAAVDKALEALRSLTCFGLLERFAPSLELFSASLGLRLDDEAPQQVTDEMRMRDSLDYAERPVVTPRLIEIIDELTEADRAFYAQAEALFAQRLASLPRPARADPSAGFGRPEPVALELFSPREGRQEGRRIVASGREGVLAVGPYMPLQHGRYRVTIHMAGVASGRERAGVSVNVWHQRGRAKVASADWTGSSPLTIDFSLPFDVRDIEFVIEVGENSAAELLSVELSRAAVQAPSAEPLPVPQRSLRAS